MGSIHVLVTNVLLFLRKMHKQSQNLSGVQYLLKFKGQGMPPWNTLKQIYLGSQVLQKCRCKRETGGLGETLQKQAWTEDWTRDSLVQSEGRHATLTCFPIWITLISEGSTHVHKCIYLNRPCLKTRLKAHAEKTMRYRNMHIHDPLTAWFRPFATDQHR